MSPDAPDRKPYVARALTPERLRWTLDPALLPFDTTQEVPTADRVLGQDDAMDALRFGLSIQAPGQNIYVRGIRGTGRWTLVKRMLDTIQSTCPRAQDRCYVFNFAHPDRPRLVTLPRGQADRFRTAMDALIRFIERDLAKGLGADDVKERAAEVERRATQEVEALTQPFEAELKENDLALMLVQVANFTRQVIVPVVDGKPAPPERLETLQHEGRLGEDDLQRIGARIEQFSSRMHEIGERIQEIQVRKVERLQKLIKGEARGLLDRAQAHLRRTWPGADVQEFLDGLTQDVIENRLGSLGESTSFVQRYRVNVILHHREDDPCPAVMENAPSVQALLGTIDRSLDPQSDESAPQMMIRGGSILRADGGYLVLDAREVLTEPGAWRALVRTLRTGLIELVPPDLPIPWRIPALKPEPIPIVLKVVLMGDAQLYYLLDALDPDFRDLFKVLADFDSVMPRGEVAFNAYASILSFIAKDETLRPFDRTAVAALIEHGARIAAEDGKLTARFGRLADIAREASWLAAEATAPTVTAEFVRDAVRRTKRRADLPSRRFRELITRGLIRVQVSGRAVGQVNGLAVVQSGPLTYGFPNRITATIGPGTAGTMNIEREAQLSGAIHNKGFYILGGLLRHLLPTQHPLAFSASVAFEQSYGGIDGDSASGAEICCLLSALTGVALRQDLAMTGAIDQVGNILPVGAVTEKIEGFYDVCASIGLTGTQGVVIPKANVGDLMLRHDVVEACRAGRFAVYAADSIHEALGLLTGVEAGQRDADGAYPEGTLLGEAMAKAGEYWARIAAAAGLEVEEAPPEAEEEEEGEAAAAAE